MRRQSPAARNSPFAMRYCRALCCSVLVGSLLASSLHAAPVQDSEHESQRFTATKLEIVASPNDLGVAVQQAQLETLPPVHPQPSAQAYVPRCQQLFRGSPAIDETLANELNVDIRPVGRGKANATARGQIIADDDLPENLAAKRLGTLRNAPQVGVGCRRFDTANLALWAAPNFYHRPLYFEQPNLERYGHYVGGNCVQSAISTAHFFGAIPLLPYKLGANPPLSCDYTLGRYRPGNCNPRHYDLPELSLHGVLNQSLFVTGAVFFVP